MAMLSSLCLAYLLHLGCPLTCQNGGTLNTSSCTCDCADGYSGKTCGSELQIAKLIVMQGHSPIVRMYVC